MSFLSAIGPIASLAGSLIGGKGKKQEVQQRENVNRDVSPPEWALPYLQGAMQRGQDIFSTPVQMFPDQPFANMDPRTRAGLDRAYNVAEGGGRLVNPTLDYAGNVLRGDYLSAPHLANASRYAINNFIPQSLSQWENLGRGGSGLAAHAMGEGISDIVAGQYNTERNRMDNMARMAPRLEQFGYQPFGQMMDIGNEFQRYDQMGIDWERDKWNFAQNEPRQSITDYGNFLRGMFPFVGQSQRSVGVQGQDAYGPSLGERIAGIGNLAGGVAQELFGRGGETGTAIPFNTGPTSTPMQLPTGGTSFGGGGFNPTLDINMGFGY